MAAPNDEDRAAPRKEIVASIPALRAFARTFYRETGEADDLVQETLTRALARIHQFEPGTSMKSWLFTIMRNTFYTRIRIETREAPGAAECVSLKPAADATPDDSAWLQIALATAAGDGFPPRSPGPNR